MKALKIFAVLALVVLTGLVLLPSEALAGFSPSRILNLYVLNKLLVGTPTEANAIGNSIVADIDYDFASSTIVCTDSTPKTATGVNKGDPCFVGIGPRDGGTAIDTANSVFLGIATADDTVLVRHCAVGTAANPADAGYTVRCFSSVP